MTDRLRGFIMTTALITWSPTTKRWEILIWTPLKGAAVMQMSVRRLCQGKTPLIVFDSCFYLGFAFCLPLLSLGMLRADYTSFGLAITWRTPPHQPLITNPHYRCQIHAGIFNPTHGSRSSSETLQQQHVNHLARYHTSCLMGYVFSGRSGNTAYINTVTEYQTFSQGQKTHLSKQAFNHQSRALHEY